MELAELIDICINKKRLVCLVGSGGKTTLMYFIAEEAARLGKRVVVATTTHIVRPDCFFAADMDEIKALWDQGHYAVTGLSDTEATNKIIEMPKQLYESLKQEADLILLEADGSKGYPCKVPAAHEPVIAAECDLVIGVMGMTALGRPLKECCFRYETEGTWLGAGAEGILTEQIAADILSSEKGTAKAVDGREYIVVLNQCDDEKLLQRAQNISAALYEKCGIAVVFRDRNNHDARTV